MVLVVSIICGIIWFLFSAVLLYSKATPEAQIRRRIHEMIAAAEAERMKNRHLLEQRNLLQKANENLPRSFEQKSFYERVVQPFMNKISDQVQELAPIQIKNLFEKLIFMAGKQGIWSVERLVLMWVITVAAGIIVAIFINRSVEYHFLQETMILIVGAVVGGILPFIRLKAIIRKRKKLMRKQLPEFLDLLCVSVQAGLSFDGAVAKIVTRMKGALISEFQRMQNDMSLGMTRQYSLTQMAKRCDLEEIYLFTASVIQAEKLGTSMSRTLKLQSDNIRDRHRQYVKAEALKAPVKIIFPMVLFIFPSIFVVLLFPAIITIMKTLGNQ